MQNMSRKGRLSGKSGIDGVPKYLRYRGPETPAQKALWHLQHTERFWGLSAFWETSSTILAFLVYEQIERRRYRQNQSDRDLPS
jgi:hypothetical protein